MNPISIKSIQSALNIPETGIYDEFTEAAVRNFQLRNALIPSGVVDADTAQLLLSNVISSGPVQDDVIPPSDVTTDLSENSSNHKVNIKKLPPYSTVNGKKIPNYLGPSKKEYLFLHHTAGWENPYNVVDIWAADTRGPVATQFIIGGPNCQTLSDKYDGEIVQCMDFKDYAWHNGLGGSPLQVNAVAIEICNFGFVTKIGGRYQTYIGKSIDPSQVVDLGINWRGHRYFHRYSNRQLDSLKFIMELIAHETGIDISRGLRDRLKSMRKFDAFDFDRSIGNIKGVYTHANVSGLNKYGQYEKWDLFPQDELCDLILSL